jgi:hypothetical protein
MRISGRHTAISQSMDLFIIIAAVLGVGGVVSASIYNLVNSATATASIVVVGASLRAGATSTASPTAISFSVKNNGGSSISCTPSTCQVVFAGTGVGTTAPACTAPCTITSGGPETWTLGGANAPLTFQAGSAAFSPGAQTSFVLNGALSSLTAGSFWASGASVTINVLFGSASAQVTVVSQ